MLEQIIYTRCSPYRDITRRGEIRGRDGVGVFSFTGAFFDKCTEEDIKVIKNRIAEKNGSREPGKNEQRKMPGLFNSYEFLLLPSGNNALTFLVARPKCDEPTRSGHLHRGGNFIKQCLVGEFSKNASELIGSPIWDAYLQDDNYYYLEDSYQQEIQLLPQKDEQIYEKGIPEELVDAFIHQDRLFLLQKGVSFLLHELGKPVGERKVLLIKDTSSNVELWIRAMLRLFPPHLANSISFSTNVTSLDLNADSRLFYYTDKKGRILEQGYASADTIRHPYCMITGYHPLDATCGSLRQTMNSSFYIIDGGNGSTTIPDEYSCNSIFYKEAFHEPDYSWFRESILSGLKNVPLSADIPNLYEAARYLMRQENTIGWKYEHVLSSLSELNRYGLFSDRKQNRTLFEKLSYYIANNAENDQNHGFALSSIARKYGYAAGYEKPLSEVSADGIRKRMTENRSTDYESIQKHLLDIQDKSFQSEILEQLFSDTYLEEYIRIFQTLPAHKTCTILDLFYFKLEICDGGINSALSSDEKTDMIYWGINAVRDSEKYALSCLKRINGYPELYCEVVSSIARNIEQSAPESITEWWRMVVSSSGKSIVQLCDDLCHTKGMTLHTIEYLLCYKIREAGKYCEDDFRSFEKSWKILPHKESDGKYFFGYIIELLNSNDVSICVQRIHSMKMREETEKGLFQQLDSRLGISKSRKNNRFYNAMCDWEKMTGFRSVYCACADFYVSLFSANSKKEAITAIQKFYTAQIPYNSTIENSDWISEIIIATSGWHDWSIHHLMLNLFLFCDKEKRLAYIRRYFLEPLEKAGKRDQISLMESICEMLCFDDKTGSSRAPQVTKQEIEKIFSDVVYAVFRPSMIRQAEKYNYKDPRTKQKLLKILYDTEGKKPESKIRLPFRFFKK